MSFAVHQCTQFSSAPTALHELAIKQNGSYLAVTQDKGLILHPKPDFHLTCLWMQILQGDSTENILTPCYKPNMTH